MHEMNISQKELTFMLEYKHLTIKLKRKRKITNKELKEIKDSKLYRNTIP